MTLQELRDKIDELIAKGYGYEGLDVYISVRDKSAAPLSHRFVPVSDLTASNAPTRFYRASSP